MLIVPIRHHSPAAALHVRRLIRERRPRVVLIEGPADATPLIPQLADPATRPPVAVYAYCRRDDEVRAAYYPFCAYSPEYVAMLAGLEIGAEVRFCDLPAGVTLGWQPDLIEAADVDAAETEATSQASVTETSEAIPRSYAEYTDALAEAAGFGSFEAFWEAAFEQEAGSGTSERYVEVMTLFGGQARRLTTARDRRQDDARERAMAATARSCLEAGVQDRDILLVCGAAHADAIAAAYAAPPESSRSASASAPTNETEVSASLALIPYSYPRLSEQAGYGAGNRAPWYYQQVWEHGGDFATATRAAMVVVARHLRQRGHPASVAQAIDAQTLAGTLAAMRDKLAPGVDELVDAAVACFGEGHGDTVAAAMQTVLIGDAVGRVTGRAGRTPLQDEFYAAADRLRLPMQDTPKVVLVHLTGNPTEAEQSVLFHRLRVLGVPFATEQASGLGGRLASDPLEQLGRVRERWEVQWSPATDAQLIERTAWGSTLAEATGRVLRERLEGAQRVDEGTATLLQLALCDLTPTAAFPEALARCQMLAVDSGSFPALSRATYHLDGLLSYGAARSLPVEQLRELAAGLFSRAALRISAAVDCSDDAVDEVRSTLQILHELVQRSSPVVGEQDTLFWESIDGVVSGRRAHPELQGLALVMLLLAGRLDEHGLTAELQFRLSGMVEGADKARLVAGLFVLHRATLVRNRSLIRAVTDFLVGLELDQLTPLLPVVRRSLGNLTGPERAYLTETLAAVLGLSDTTTRRALHLSSTDREWLAEADRAVAATLQDWKDRYGIGA